MSKYQTYTIAIARCPNVIRRTAREASGDLVLGFAFNRKRVDPYTDRITCDLLNAGNWFTDAILKSALDTLCVQFGQETILRAVASWMEERSNKGEVPMWARTF